MTQQSVAHRKDFGECCGYFLDLLSVKSRNWLNDRLTVLDISLTLNDMQQQNRYRFLQRAVIYLVEWKFLYFWPIFGAGSFCFCVQSTTG